MSSASLANAVGATTLKTEATNGAVASAADAAAIRPGDIDTDFLPLIHDVIKTVEKDNQDASQKNKDSLEASQKVIELSKKISSARDAVYKLPGIEFDQDEQLKQIQTLKNELALKKALIFKYKSLNLSTSGLSGKLC